MIAVKPRGMIRSYSRMWQRIRTSRWSLFVVGITVGAVSVWGAEELRYVDWQSVVPPLDQAALIIRQDAKGDGRFGASRSGNRRHQGVDLEAPLGSPVRAIRSGQVIQIGRHRGLGLFVEVEHRRILQSLYAHLNTVNVEAGDRVRQGQVIGTVGKTGNARHRWITPHLHLEVHRAGSPIDPKTLGLAMIEPATHPENAHADGGE